MKGSSNDNGKISDSGYTNTCIGQSQRSSSSSLSRNTNNSESSGYCGGQPSACDSSNYALPQPISKRKDKEHKKKKSKAATTTTDTGKVEAIFGSYIKFGQPNTGETHDSNESSSDLTSNCKKTEIAGVELVDDTGLGEHNGDSHSTEPEGGIGTITNPLEDTASNVNAAFSVVVSMKNGRVVDATSSLKGVLGYSRKSWINRSFIEFLHPKDKQIFTKHLAKNTAVPFEDHDKDPSGRQTSIFCSLRRNDDGRSTIGSTSEGANSSLASMPNSYLLVHLTMSIKIFCDRTSDKTSRMMFLIINAEPIIPVYKAPEEMIISTIFSTRHDRNCILTHVDINVVQYFGYTPQDIIGRSMFDFYHPEDLPFLKDVYETVVKMAGAPFRSKPYRFAAQNGDYVLLDTEWASFFNPWTEKLEFVVGHHRILRGPLNPNVFQAPVECERNLLASISEEILKESKIIQGEIRARLNEKIQKTEANEERAITSRSKDLHIFVGNLLREVKPLMPVAKDHLRSDNSSFLEHDSAVLGAISPHYECGDSKSSMETPPSYSQLNYNAKLKRFFDSELLVTTAYGSDEDINMSTSANEEAEKHSSNLTGTKDSTLSAENLSSGVNNRTNYDSRDDSDNLRDANSVPGDDSKCPTLTESILNKHNQDMEKLLMQHYKERRSNIKNSNKHNNDAKLEGKQKKKSKEQAKSRGVKRTSTDRREEEYCKAPKHDENTQMCASAPAQAKVSPRNDDSGLSPDKAAPTQDTNIWPSLTLTIPTQPAHPQTRVAATNNEMQQDAPKYATGFMPLVPVYYMPLSKMRNDVVPIVVPTVTSQSLQSGQPQQSTFASLAGVIYPPMMYTPTPATTMHPQFVIPAESTPIQRKASLVNSDLSNNPSQPGTLANRMKGPASQATSVKANPGSIKAPSESSKRLLSLGEHFSSCVSIDGGCSSLVPNTQHETNSQFDSSLEDSSDSSFYSSFLTKSNGSSCNQNPKTVEHPRQKSPCKPTTVHEPTNNHKDPLEILRKGPPWQEGVKMTNELIYQYQLTPKPLDEVLEADMKVLKSLNQSQMVNDQLAQLCLDMAIDAAGFSPKLLLREGDASIESESSSSDEDARNVILEPNSVRSDMNFTTMTMIYEENAPLPSHAEIQETST